MADIPTLLENIKKLTDIWSVSRQGIITTFNGARVGTWKYDTNRLLLNYLPSEGGKEFRKLIRDFSRNGIMVNRVTARKGSSTQIIFEQIPFSRLSPGELDPLLKEQGYFMIDLNLPELTTNVEDITDTPESAEEVQNKSIKE